MDIAEEHGLRPEQVVIDHNNEETVAEVLGRGFWAAFTIYPRTKMDSERMVEIVRNHGHERVIVDSSADWGVSDPTSVVKTARLMLERGIEPAAVEAVTYRNALAAYGRSGQIREEHWLAPPRIDQRRSFAGNTVLRGQEPRVDAAATSRSS
jgi:hypothetical protein